MLGLSPLEKGSLEQRLEAAFEIKKEFIVEYAINSTERSKPIPQYKWRECNLLDAFLRAKEVIEREYRRKLSVIEQKELLETRQLMVSPGCTIIIK